MYYVILYYIVSCCIVLYYIILYYVTLHNIVLYYIITSSFSVGLFPCLSPDTFLHDILVFGNEKLETITESSSLIGDLAFFSCTWILCRILYIIILNIVLLELHSTSSTNDFILFFLYLTSFFHQSKLNTLLIWLIRRW